MSDRLEQAWANYDRSVGAPEVLPGAVPHERAEVEAAIRAEYAPLVEAARDLLKKGRLSFSSGGDPGMIFDEFDAEVERERQGTVTFDASYVLILTAALPEQQEAERGD